MPEIGPKRIISGGWGSSFITRYQHDARDEGVCCDPVDPTSLLDKVPEQFISVVPL